MTQEQLNEIIDELGMVLSSLEKIYKLLEQQAIALTGGV